jgi:hypothetical protein
LEALLALQAPYDPSQTRAEQADVFVESAIFYVGVSSRK